ncbi:MAG: glycosyltransferase [Elusimicrobiota bacterium]
MNILHILTMHQPAGLENRAFRFIQTADKYNHFVLVVSNRIEKKFDIKKEKIKIIHNGIPMKKIEEIAPVKRDKNKFIVLYLGRLVAVKGIYSLIRSFKYLDDSFELWIVGKGKERHSLNKLVLNEGVSDKVFFKGFQSCPDSFLKAADVMAVADEI